MFPLFRKNFSFLHSLSSPQIRTLPIRFPVREFSSSSSSSSSSHPQPHCKQIEPENVRVSVWWNFNDCGVPSGFCVQKTAHSIMGAVRAHGIKGPIDIRAYGQFSEFQRTALSLSHIQLCDVTPGERAHKWLFSDLLMFSYKNHPPIHLFLISGDGGLSNSSNLSVLHGLRMENYNFLVACPGGASEAICSLATILWPWSSILKGEDLTGKYFNYPPDGPFGSWYGGSNVPLENPFPATKDVTP